MSKYNAASYESLTRHDRRDIDSNTEVKQRLRKHTITTRIIYDVLDDDVCLFLTYVIPAGTFDKHADGTIIQGTYHAIHQHGINPFMQLPLY